MRASGVPKCAGSMRMRSRRNVHFPPLLTALPLLFWRCNGTSAEDRATNHRGRYGVVINDQRTQDLGSAATGGDRGPNRSYILLRSALDMAGFKFAGYRRQGACTISLPQYRLGFPPPGRLSIADSSVCRYARRPKSLRAVAFGSKKGLISTRECRVSGASASQSEMSSV
jgi:hypothetical protein